MAVPQNKAMRHITVPVMEFKYDQQTGEFSCYANVKNVIDHAMDRTVDGCFVKSIEGHQKNGTMPKMLWMHNPWELPVGKWTEMREDSKGLFMRGKLSKTSMGSDIEVLAKDGALDSFSIGYIVNDERWNGSKNCNDLLDVDVKEVSWVNFACNEASLLQDIKAGLTDGHLPSKAELREILKTTGLMSKRAIERITAAYNPEIGNDEPSDEQKEFLEFLAKSKLFN